MFYIYEWYVINTNEVFYVGKGTNLRYKVRKHNKIFEEYLNNYDGTSRIVKEFESESEAFSEEDRLISYYWSIGQCKCNLHRGGYGGEQSWWTEELRHEYSLNNVMKRPEQRQRMSTSNPMYNSKISQKVKESNMKPLYVGQKRFDGLVDAAKYYDVTSTAILYWINRGCSSNGDVCYYEGTTPNYNAKPSGSFEKKSVVIDGIYYPSINAAAVAVNGSAENLGKALREHRKFKGHECTYGNQQPSRNDSNIQFITEGSTTNE